VFRLKTPKHADVSTRPEGLAEPHCWLGPPEVHGEEAELRRTSWGTTRPLPQLHPL